ncbi:MAG: lipid A deacylase LpxR family protein [Flavobacteriales bacterium]|nr:lipid A deacylase LpxR family protein [Flavobacteriales bacterium]MBK6943284.1 lipid A deacylase LpxR family protein [Flavobacteriales bacterium]MBK7240838.1 lipid A deacylase LpxR family protein [Flavobacteriales bacterium]MBK7296553.1 lipid A deacylase LpxR family protein [Flavobacteriales bacterium]MBK9536185.1 lipid A deacylase LpxR family protein [Flavobacteriales bacterium]
MGTRFVLTLVVIIFNCVSASYLFGGTPEERWFRFRYDNDFFTATDQYFTQGIRLELRTPWISSSPLRHVLPRFSGAARQQDNLFAQQECFTPTSIRRDTILRTDRPFAAALYIGQRSKSTNTDRKEQLTSALSIGIIGPCALCAGEQRGIHKALNNIEPLGWQFQIQNDVIVNYALQFDQRLIASRFAEISGGAGATVGSFRTHADVNLRGEIGLFNSHFDEPVDILKKLRISTFLQGNARFVGYDATFQGGLFNTYDPHVIAPTNMERIVLFAEGGVTLRYRGIGLSYTKSFITRQFTTGRDHAWGSCVITAYF